MMKVMLSAIDGQPAGPSPSLTVNAGALGTCTHTVSATVRDQTTIVRTDPEQLLTERVGWVVDVREAFGNLPNLPVPVRRDRFVAETRAIGSGVVVNVGD